MRLSRGLLLRRHAGDDGVVGDDSSGPLVLLDTFTVNLVEGEDALVEGVETVFRGRRVNDDDRPAAVPEEAFLCSLPVVDGCRLDAQEFQ